MVAGLPPYQAQDTRKLEQLIQSRRPPRALPDGCPSVLKAILNKALTGDLHQRYVSAAAFENDLRLFVQQRPTVAETEQRTAWKTNQTVEKPRLKAIPERISSMADTVRRSVMKLKPARSLRVVPTLRVLVALCWGLLSGLVVCVPVGYYYRFTRESRPISGTLDYTRRSIASINGDWDLFQKLQSRNAFLGTASPAKKLSSHLRAGLIQAADEIINRYRNSSDPDIQHFDWQKAVMCLRHALETEPSDRAIQGKLALSIGYVNLSHANAEPPGNRLASVQTAQANFNEAVTLIPGAPDPHLALARIYIYDFKNIGTGAAELHEAQRLGFQLGPRETEQQADGYRFRANVELAEARLYRGKSRANEERYLRLAQRDFERARQLYEPIVGFSNVSVALRQVDDDDRVRKQLDGSLKAPVRQAPSPRRLRARRWQ